MAYILGVNPVILGDAGMPQSGVFFATAFVSAIASILMGLFSKYPLAIAPGMGYNALFSYTIVIGMGNFLQLLGKLDIGQVVLVSSLVFWFMGWSKLIKNILLSQKAMLMILFTIC